MKTTKASIAGFILIFCASYCSAQFVTIPQKFATYIATHIEPTAIVGSDLDTTNATILALQDLHITAVAGVDDITGIKYFAALKNLILEDSAFAPVTSLPELPPLLETLEMDGIDTGTQQLTNVTSFPPTLRILKLPHSCISVWPALPTTLTKLRLDFSCIGTLPPLPNSIDTLLLNYCPNITSLPSPLPSSLRYLAAKNTPIVSIPLLPSNLSFLSLEYDIALTSIGTLSPVMQTLNLAYTQISSIPGNLPSTLYYLNLTQTPITALQTLPDTMAYLSLSYTPISSIANLPHYAHYINLDNVSSLSSLPNYPVNCTEFSISNDLQFPVDNILYSMTFNGGTYSNLDYTLLYTTQSAILDTGYYYLYLNQSSVSAEGDNLSRIPVNNSGTYFYSFDFAHNQILTLSPAWLNSVENLNLSFNSIGVFSVTPNQYTYCYNINLSNNQITVLDSLPVWGGAYLGTSMDFSNNQITAVNNKMLKFRYMNLQNNQINCLPLIVPPLTPDTNNIHLYISGNPIQCLPNTVNNLVTDVQLPICQQGNTYNCNPTGTITGIVFNDINGNGFFDGNDTVLKADTVNMYFNGQLTFMVTDTAGRYTFQTPLNVQDTVLLMDTGTITTGGIYPFLTAPYQIDSNRDIGVMYVLPSYDLAVTLTSYTDPRPGFDYSYYIDCYNHGSLNQDGNLSFTFNSLLFYQGSTPPGTVSGNSISWPVDTLLSGQHMPIKVDFIVPATMALHTIIGAAAVASSIYPDTILSNNASMVIDTVVGSYDPNDKRVQPALGLSQAEIDTFAYLTYTIRFQNSGTASAINIRVEDTLSPLLNLNTLQIVTNSHPGKYHLEGRVLVMEYLNINLPDSNTNEPLSHGFFTYKVRIDSSFSSGMTVSNTAYIYFDFNSPVATNTTTTGKYTGIAEVGNTVDQLQLYPNPASDVLNINWTTTDGKGKMDLEVVNALGQTIDKFTLPQQATYQLNVKDYAPGVYSIRYRTEGKTKSQRFVVGR